MIAGGWGDRIDISASWAGQAPGQAPGTHTVGFDGSSESNTLTHQTRDRRTFANGETAAARWILERHGRYSMEDVLGLDIDPLPR